MAFLQILKSYLVQLPYAYADYANSTEELLGRIADANEKTKRVRGFLQRYSETKMSGLCSDGRNALKIMTNLLSTTESTIKGIENSLIVDNSADGETYENHSIASGIATAIGIDTEKKDADLMALVFFIYRAPDTCKLLDRQMNIFNFEFLMFAGSVLFETNLLQDAVPYNDEKGVSCFLEIPESDVDLQLPPPKHEDNKGNRLDINPKATYSDTAMAYSNALWLSLTSTLDNSRSLSGINSWRPSVFNVLAANLSIHEVITMNDRRAPQHFVDQSEEETLVDHSDRVYPAFNYRDNTVGGLRNFYTKYNEQMGINAKFATSGDDKRVPAPPDVFYLPRTTEIVKSSRLHPWALLLVNGNDNSEMPTLEEETKLNKTRDLARMRFIAKHMASKYMFESSKNDEWRRKQHLADDGEEFCRRYLKSVGSLMKEGKGSVIEISSTDVEETNALKRYILKKHAFRTFYTNKNLNDGYIQQAIDNINLQAYNIDKENSAGTNHDYQLPLRVPPQLFDDASDEARIGFELAGMGALDKSINYSDLWLIFASPWHVALLKLFDDYVEKTKKRNKQVLRKISLSPVDFYRYTLTQSTKMTQMMEETWNFMQGKGDFLPSLGTAILLKFVNEGKYQRFNNSNGWHTYVSSERLKQFYIGEREKLKNVSFTMRDLAKSDS